MSQIARRRRSARQDWAAPGSSHDRIVAIAQKVLPMLVGVLAAFLITAPLFKSDEMSFLLDKSKVNMAKERMKVERAQYRGEDSKGRTFTLVAGSAVQKSSAEPVVKLNDLGARIQLPDGPAQLSAQHGRYDMDKKQVAIDGPLSFRAANGYSIDTSDATVDLDKRTMESGGPVEGRTPLGSFSANRVSADLQNRTVKLSGDARLRIVPNKAKGRK